jgi:hypothetical protein
MKYITLLAVASAALLAACNEKPNCLANDKEVATVLDVEDVCSLDRKVDCLMLSGVRRTWQRLRLKRDRDGTVCATFSDKWMYKPGDKVRGPM